jgi:hypothetical protein
MAIAPRVDPSPEVPVGPGGRFRILDPGPQWAPRAEYPDDPQGEPAFDGSGLVLDTKTGLKWTRFWFVPRAPGVLTKLGIRLKDGERTDFRLIRDHAERRQARLPSLAEVLDLFADESWDGRDVWPQGFAAWTTTLVPEHTVPFELRYKYKYGFSWFVHGPRKGIVPAKCARYATSWMDEDNGSMFVRDF